jgi:hypothetical protein
MIFVISLAGGVGVTSNGNPKQQTSSGTPLTGGVSVNNGILSSFSETIIILLMTLLALFYLIALLSGNIRSFIKDYGVDIAKDMPGVGETFGILGIVLAAVTVIFSIFYSTGEIFKFYAPIVFFVGATFWLFLYLLLANHITNFVVYFSRAAFASAIYCLGFGLFTFVDLLLPETWYLRYLLLLAPLACIIDALLSLINMYNFQK